MDENNYYLIAFRIEPHLNLSKHIDDIKDIVCSFNYDLDKNHDIRLLLNAVSYKSLKLILKTPTSIREAKENIIIGFQKQINDFIKSKTGDENCVLGDKIFEIELSEMVLNKIILNMKEQKNKEFDLLSSINLNPKIAKILNKEISNELESELEDNYPEYKHRNRFMRAIEQNSNNINNMNYSKEDLITTTEHIQGSIKLNTCLTNELNIISKMFGKIGKPINYFLYLEHTGLCEDEISKIILSHQFHLGVIKKPELEIMTIDKIVYPPRSVYPDGYKEDLELIEYKKDRGILINNAERIIDLKELELNKLINFISKVNVPFIFIIDNSNISTNSKLNNNLDKLINIIIARKILINQPSQDSYCNNIVNALKQCGYKTDDNFKTEDLIDYVKTTYGSSLKMSNIKLIVDRIIFNQELNDSGRVINNNSIANNLNQSATDTSLYNASQELESMIGLNHIKNKVKEFIALYDVNKKRKSMGLSTKSISMHMVLKGNPGTGKTSFSRVFGSVLKEKNIISKGTFIEVSREDLVGKYVGWTANIISDYFKKADGGVLFIDEAYLLNSDFERGYGEEAIGAIVNNMELFRDRVVVIFAGYPFEMDKFISANPGMKSRIGLDITIDDYTEFELLEIFKLFVRERNYEVDKDVLIKVQKNLSNMIENNNDGFGNARYVRNLVEKIQLSQAKRISTMETVSEKDLIKVILQDLDFLDSDRSFYHRNKAQTIGFVR